MTATPPSSNDRPAWITVNQTNIGYVYQRLRTVLLAPDGTYRGTSYVEVPLPQGGSFRPAFAEDRAVTGITLTNNMLPEIHIQTDASNIPLVIVPGSWVFFDTFNTCFQHVAPGTESPLQTMAIGD